MRNAFRPNRRYHYKMTGMLRCCQNLLTISHTSNRLLAGVPSGLARFSTVAMVLVNWVVRDGDEDVDWVWRVCESGVSATTSSSSEELVVWLLLILHEYLVPCSHFGNVEGDVGGREDAVCLYPE